MMNLNILTTALNNITNTPAGKSDTNSLLSDANAQTTVDFSTLLGAQTSDKSGVDINATLVQLAQQLAGKGQIVNKATLVQAALAGKQDGSLTLDNDQLKQLTAAIEQLTDSNIPTAKTSDALKTVLNTDKKVIKDETDADSLTQPVQALFAMLAAQPQVVDKKTLDTKAMAADIQQQSSTDNMLAAPGKAADASYIVASLLSNGDSKTIDPKTIDTKTIDTKTVNTRTIDTKTIDTNAGDARGDKNDRVGIIKDKGKLANNAAVISNNDSVNAKADFSNAITSQQPAATQTTNSADNNTLLQAMNQAHSAAASVATPMTLTTPTQSAAVNAPAVPFLNAQLGSAEWQQSLSHQVLMFNRQGQQTAELRLHPEDLGSIQISMKIQDNQAQIHFVSGHSQVRAAIESAMPELRTALADNGISLGQSSVGSDASGWQQAQQQSGQQSGAQDQGNRASWATHADSNNLVSTSDALPVPAALLSLANGNGAIDTFA